MPSVKIYYDSIPGDKSNMEYYPDHKVFWINNTDNFGLFMTALGFDVEYTNDPKEGIVWFDTESCEFQSKEGLDLLYKLASKFPRLIIGSLNEPHTISHGEKFNFLNKFPGVILASIRDMPKHPLQHERIVGVPSFLIRVVSPAFNTLKIHHLPKAKENPPLLYNCLNSRWDLQKCYTLYSLKKHGMYTEGVLSYNRPKGMNLNSIEEIEEYIDSSPFSYDKGFSEFIAYQPNIRLVKDEFYNCTTRQWPMHLFTSTKFSLVNETGTWLTDEARGQFDATYGYCISEKSVYPMLNQHPIIAVACRNFHKYINDWGFELYENLFDYSFDAITDPIDRTDKLIEDNVQNFNEKKYNDTIDTTRKIAMHNRNNLLNPNSVMFKKLRKQMEELIEMYYDL